MKKSIYHWYQRLPPQFRDRVRWIRHPVNSFVTTAIYRLAQHKVVSGPFKGMILVAEKPHLPYLLGTQELELHQAIETLVGLGLEKIVNVGAADGYYAVGMTLRCPNAKIVAFEADTFRHEDLTAAAKANGVFERLQIEGRCEPSDLAAVLTPDERTLLIVDVEGYEMDLLDPDITTGLRDVFLLVETHDILRQGCAQAMARSFDKTHTIDRLSTRSRNLGDFPIPTLRAFGAIARRSILGAMFEQRAGAQEFLVMSPKCMR